MSGKDFGPIGKLHQVGTDTSDEGLVRSPGEIGSTDAAGKKHVSPDQKTFFRTVKDHASSGVAGNVKRRKHGSLNLDGSLAPIWNLDRANIGDRRDLVLNAEKNKTSRIADEGCIGRMNVDRTLMAIANLGGIPNMIEMAMGQDQGMNTKPLVREKICHALGRIEADSLRAFPGWGEPITVRGQESSHVHLQHHRTTFMR